MPQTRPAPLSVARTNAAPAIVRKSAPVVRQRASVSDAETSVTGIHTALLTLSPAFLDALKKVAPKKRRSKVPYVIAIAMLAVIAVLGADASTREFGIGKGRQLVARLQHKPAAAPAPAVAAPAPSAVAQAATPAGAQPSPVAAATPAAAPAAPAAAKEEAPAPVVMKLAATRKSTKASGKPQPRPVARQVLSRL